MCKRVPFRTIPAQTFFGANYDPNGVPLQTAFWWYLWNHNKWREEKEREEKKKKEGEEKRRRKVKFQAIALKLVFVQLTVGFAKVDKVFLMS